MVIHMKTTLVIPPQIMRRLKQEAARRGTTMSALVESALRLFLDGGREPAEDIGSVPVFHMGRPLADVADRGELYDLMGDA